MSRQRDRLLLEETPAGLYCAAGDFYIDPRTAVERAVITHAHSDHARRGSRAYLCAEPGRSVLAERMGPGAAVQGIAYGESVVLGGAEISLHPAGHILGSAQVRVEVGGEVWVVSGDYNISTPCGTCEPFEPLRCEVFITESTFALPIYHWPDPDEVFEEIHGWWERNREAGVTSVIPAYPLGKSQRLLAGLDPSAGPIAIHGSALNYARLYEAAGVPLPPYLEASETTLGEIRGRGLLITSSALENDEYLDRLGPTSQAFASGWMMTRAARRSRSFDRGFVLSDHADWDGLVAAVKGTGARRVRVTHGQSEVFARWLRELGWDAEALGSAWARREDSDEAGDG